MAATMFWLMRKMVVEGCSMAGPCGERTASVMGTVG